MNAATWFSLICSVLVLTALVWAGCAWWYRRKLGEIQHKLEKSRFAASQFAGQAKRQIGQLQKELSERPPLPKAQRVVRDEAAEAAVRKQKLEDKLDDVPAPKLPANGFADTQPM